ncbi:hypothetical protein [Actinoplanes sp. M2I2]|uniref:hypothetical protein n=1 Tax=Actinoplanes sp. M2I2 TaxID=1734444 RepID=UPI0020207BD9|nr:hypothetical protein [Actinoplanes sp. M2I2]
MELDDVPGLCPADDRLLGGTGSANRPSRRAVPGGTDMTIIEPPPDSPEHSPRVGDSSGRSGAAKSVGDDDLAGASATPRENRPVEQRWRAKGSQPSDHLNDRPSWDCVRCRAPWPCASAQDSLVEEFRAFPSVLTIYMTAQMYDALSDLVSTGQMAPADLFERFLAWARRAAVHPEGAGRCDLDDVSTITPKRVMT